MLSIVVVGRNDSHGYNLGKRVASSLNSLSLPMSGEDELIFVDWNSDDINPTFIDAIKDTLTEQTLKHLVVYRVRSKIHYKLAVDTNRPILEPIARNVGIRRAKNPWILSTNTDMIFETYGKTYTEILRKLEPNLYHLFRFEIPEYIWDQFDRKNPNSNLYKIRKLFSGRDSKTKILTKPYDGHPNLFPDAVGDFQLTTKKIWESVKGFPEEMLKGWHVDSRLSVQIENKNDLKSQILDSSIIEGYHQNHLRVLTHFHATSSINSLAIIGKTYSNPENWGLAELSLEPELEKSFSIDKCDIITNKLEVFNQSELTLHDYLQSAIYTSKLITTFLLDDLVNLPPNSKVLISSIDDDFAMKLNCTSTNLLGKTLDLNFVIPDNCSKLDEIDLFILDFGIPENMIANNDRSQIIGKFEKTIANNFSLLEKIPGNSRISTIRTQHWTLRGLIHEYCIVPLFNNYSAILSGRKKDSTNLKRPNGLRSLRNTVREKIHLNSILVSLNEYDEYLINQIRSDALPMANGSLKLEIHLERKNNLLTIAYNNYKKLPFMIRNYLNPKIRKFFKFY